MGVYLYTLRQPYTLRSELLAGVAFQNEWVRITPDGTMTIAAGYAWDGCSPKLLLPGVPVLVGVWDGPLMPDGYPQTAWASLVHDVLCQWRHQIAVRKADVVRLFDRLLDAAGWRHRRLYVTAVKIFGPRRFAGDIKQGGV